MFPSTVTFACSSRLYLVHSTGLDSVKFNGTSPAWYVLFSGDESIIDGGECEVGDGEDVENGNTTIKGPVLAAIVPPAESFTSRQMLYVLGGIL